MTGVRLTKRERAIDLGCSSPGFDREEDCQAFIEDVRLALRIEEAQDTLAGLREQIHSAFDAAGLDIDNDDDLDELVRVEHETLCEMAAVTVNLSTADPDRSYPLWVVTAYLPADAFVAKDEAAA